MSLLRGTVIDNQDPMQRGRCRVFVWGMHKEEDPNIPWAETAGSTMFGLHKGVGYSGVLQVGTTVWVQFEQADIQCPVIVGVFVGHDAETMGDISKENSDFHPDAKGDNYGTTWMFNTPAGNSFKMDDASPRIHITTPNGFELDLNDNDRKLRLGTPCGPEIVMECDGKLTITNGQATMKFDGPNIIVDANMQVNGHITSQGVFAPNLCTCSSPGAPFSGSPTSQESKRSQKQKECSPRVDANGTPDCGDQTANNDLKTLSDKMAKLVDEAKVIYADLNNNKDTFKVCETKMTPERYNCLTSGGKSVPTQMMCGNGVLVVGHNESCDSVNPQSNAESEEKPAGECGSGKFEGIQDFKATVASMESGGDYGKYNKGEAQNYKIATLDPNSLTIREYFRRAKSVDPRDPERIFAFGKYQIVPNTMKGIYKAAGLNEDSVLSPKNQEKLFAQLIKNRRAIGNYITGNGSAESAAMALAHEWASFGVPKDTTNGGKQIKRGESFYKGKGNNKAHVSPDKVIASLNKLKNEVERLAKERNMTKQQMFDCMLRID